MRFYFLVQILLLSLSTRAEINMKDASYKASFTDLPGIQRTYNSRSLYTGYFGFGWCSNLEKSLVINESKEISYKECDQETPFVLMDESNLLKSRTFVNPSTREKIIFKNGAYNQYLNSGEVRIYDRKGKLLNVLAANGDKIGLLYNLNHLTIVKINSQFPMKFYFNGNYQITKIETQNESVSYLYDKDKLIQSYSKKQSHEYEYDELSNLVKLTYPDQKTEKIYYQNDFDKVAKVELAGGCVEYFDSKMNSDNLYQVSTLTRKCESRKTEIFTYEFWYKAKTNGEKYLERYKIHQTSQTLDISYHPITGNPIRIVKNGKELFRI